MLEGAAALALDSNRSVGLGRTRWAGRSIFVLCVMFAMSATRASASSILNAAGPVADGERLILLDALGIMLAIVIPTIGATLLFAWWYRASNKSATYRPEWQYSGRLEVLVWAIPALVVLFLGGLAWISSHTLDPAKPLVSSKKTLEVQVVSLDWRWLFIYPDQHIATINRLVLPVGTPVHLRITSASVMNVFFVPRLAGEMYSMNGMVTQLNLQADQTGRFPGLSAQFSGDGFAGMSFDAVAVAPSQFAAFVTQARGVSDRLDDTAYRSLSRQSHDTHVRVFGQVSDGLFDDIASLKLPPGEGPEPQPAMSNTAMENTPNMAMGAH
jgi:cytochrome o ubiquinol oxidase subunit 2